ncbi:hypothetical protein BDQ17DRAFT_1339664, partial [Cyathus striatus]
MFFNSKFFSALVLAFVAGVHAETHTVHFINKCGFGTPTLIQGPNVLSTGDDYTSNGPLTAAIAYLQTAEIDTVQSQAAVALTAEGCTLIELTLINPTSPGSVSSADISLIPPYAFSVASGFG